MNRTQFLRIVTAMVFCFFAVTTKRAEADSDPESAAARCLARVEHLEQRCINAVEGDVESTLQEIRRLLADGQTEAAAQSARQCLRATRANVRLCVSEIRETCSRCIDFLILWGAEELAARVRWNCGAAIESLENLVPRVENALQGALAG